MKNLIVTLAVISLIGVGAIAYGHGTGAWGGHMMGPGYGGGHRYSQYQKFLDETVDLRKELHGKRFEYFEALRNTKTTTEAITKLEKEIAELEDKIYEKALVEVMEDSAGTAIAGNIVALPK